MSNFRDSHGAHHNSGAFIASVLGVAEYQDRQPPRVLTPRAQPRPWLPPHLEDLTDLELAEARLIAREQRYPMAEAAEIVRRSRR